MDAGGNASISLDIEHLYGEHHGWLKGWLRTHNQGSNFYAPTTNYRIEQEAYTLVDLMTSYKATENVDVRLNINNVFDKKYYQSIGTNTVYGSSQYGDPRNAMVTVRWSL